MNINDMIGKTISAATLMKHECYDDEGWLRLEFTDGTACVIVGGYGGFSGNSEDEYPTFICVADDVADLVPNVRANLDPTA